MKNSEDKWKQELTKEEYEVLRNKGTERAFTGIYWNHFEKGEYKCRGCGKILFSSSDKFDSSCGWPSFYKPAESSLVKRQLDTSHGMVRAEILCSNCDGHLGHVFNDADPKKGGKRYCINSISLKFKKV